MNTPGDAAITEAIIGLARGLGLKVVAEGVEHESTLRMLRTLGCDLAQGYLLSRPLPAREFSDWVAARATPASLTQLIAQLQPASRELRTREQK